jgi:hypothetical protein
MASSSDPWVKEYNEASRLADDINSMIAERVSSSMWPRNYATHFSYSEKNNYSWDKTG